MWKGVIEEFKEFLPITENTPFITLGEGDTPLIRVDNLAREIGFLGKLYLKFEGANPTGSFKDRGMVLAVAKALEHGYATALCASTGNTASSAAAYCAHVGMRCIVLMPAGKVARGKLVQTVRYGAKVIQINGNFDQALQLTKHISQNHQVALLNSLNPDRIQGQKTAAFEIMMTLGKAPDYHFIPVGNAGNITAYWMGYKEYSQYKVGSWTLPRMMGYQASGAAPIVKKHIIKNPKTVASAINIGNPASWQSALDAQDESGGLIDSVTDPQILTAYRMIPRTTGIFCEPASAASIAGVIKALKKGQIVNTEDTVIVCTITGNGLKDQDTAMIGMDDPITIDVDIEKALKLISP